MASFIIRTFGGPNVLSSGSGVVDVAGGSGALTFEFSHFYRVKSTVVDPVKAKLSSKQQRAVAHRRKVSAPCVPVVIVMQTSRFVIFVKRDLRTWTCRRKGLVQQRRQIMQTCFLLRKAMGWPHTSTCMVHYQAASHRRLSHNCLVHLAMLPLPIVCPYSRRPALKCSASADLWSDSNAGCVDLPVLVQPQVQCRFEVDYNGELLADDTRSAELVDLVENASILVGLHPDEVPH
eukprot:8616763-Pyramimonas_sp.AAC.1